MADCYSRNPIDPKYSLSQLVLTSINEEGVILKRGRNVFGNIYYVRVNKPKFDEGPTCYHIQEESLKSA